MIRILGLAALLVAAPVAAASDEAAQSGFAAKLAVTPDREAFLTAWAGPTPPQLVVTSAITPGRPVHAMLIFSGCRAAPSGHCDVTARFAVVSPDGKVTGGDGDHPVWKRTPPPAPMLVLAHTSFEFGIDAEEPLGPYVLRTIVTDRVAGITLTLAKTVTAKASLP